MRKWVLGILLMGVVLSVLFLAGKSEETSWLQIRFIGYDTNGMAIFGITNRSNMGMDVSKPCLQVQTHALWITDGETNFTYDFSTGLGPGSNCVRYVSLPESNFTWRAQFQWLVFEERWWKLNWSRAVQKLGFPPSFEYRSGEITTPEFRHDAEVRGR